MKVSIVHVICIMAVTEKQQNILNFREFEVVFFFFFFFFFLIRKMAFSENCPVVVKNFFQQQRIKHTNKIHSYAMSGILSTCPT